MFCEESCNRFAGVGSCRPVRFMSFKLEGAFRAVTAGIEMDIAAIKDKSLGGGGGAAADKKDKDKKEKGKPEGKAASKAKHP